MLTSYHVHAPFHLHTEVVALNHPSTPDIRGAERARQRDKVHNRKDTSTQSLREQNGLDGQHTWVSDMHEPRAARSVATHRRPSTVQNSAILHPDGRCLLLLGVLVELVVLLLELVLGGEGWTHARRQGPVPI